MVKRAFDLIVASVSLVLLSPLFLVTTMLIWLSDGGPAFFVQERTGKDGKQFRLCKFRTMSVLESAREGRFDAGCTARVTPVGKILRRTKIDEFPQLINVLKGDMSLVGPRPEVQKWTTVYPERWKKVLTVAPGITDKASIEFRDEEALLSRSAEPEKVYRDLVLPQKLGLYEEYVDNQSFFGDIRLIFKTIFYCLFK